ncbi:MAG: DUF3117 domain-containing protein [Actinobacteria bacterium]|nr:DUF3117 domain-containing protein [Actinomycetota bacterium]
MAAQKPRTGEGPMECVQEARHFVVRIPAEGGGRVVIALNAAEVKELSEILIAALAPKA